MLTVEYDHQIFTRQRRGGVSRLFVELTREFNGTPDLGVRAAISGLMVRNDYVRSVEHRGRPRVVAEGGVLDRRRVCKAVNDLWAWRPRHRADIVHVTYYDVRSLAPSSSTSRPLVCTVYDMIPELHPDLVLNPNAHEAKMEVIDRSDLVLCISQSVAYDLQRYVDHDLPNVQVAPLGARPVDESVACDRSRRRKDLVLFVGHRQGYKSFDVLLDAVRRSGIECEVVCVGGGPFTSTEQAAVRNLATGCRVRQADLDDNELIALYAQATVFVSTSLAEGFGLPAVEAMASGCPVILTDIAAYRETAGSAAVLYPPGDHQALGDALAHVLASEDVQGDLARRGWQRARQFTWAACAAATAAAYRTIA